MNEADIELRKHALQIACALQPVRGNDFDVILHAQRVYDFLTAGKWYSTAIDKPAATADLPVVTSPADTDALHVRPMRLAALTPLQKSALRTAIDLFRASGRVTGTDVARAMHWSTPGNINATFKKLMAMGYVRRTGWFLTPIYTADGVAVGPVIQKLPDGVARGYKPMTAKIGEVGRIS